MTSSKVRIGITGECQDPQNGVNKDRKLESWSRNQIKCPPDKDLNVTVGKIVDHGRDAHNKGKDRVSQQVRNDPAHRTFHIIAMGAFDLKFTQGSERNFC